jgi:iron(III) transport system permease protein
MLGDEGSNGCFGVGGVGSFLICMRCQTPSQDSASMCGAGNFVVLYRIVVPLASLAIIATSIYVFMHAIRDLSVAILLPGPNNSIVSIVILDLWNNGEIPEFAAFSVLVAAGTTVLGSAGEREGFTASER